MTINQAFDKLTELKELNEEQKKLKLSLLNLKKEFGGRMQIENVKKVKSIIEGNTSKDADGW